MQHFQFCFLLVLLWTNYACQGESSSDNRVPSSPQTASPTEVVSIEPKQTSAKVDSTSYRYPWKKNYDVRQALINQISLPAGYKRVTTRPNTFGDWLRFLPLQAPGAKVHYFDGREKWSQDLHERVVDLDIGKKDLQQCADAIMRLQAEFHYSQQAYDQIHFNYTSGDRVAFDDWRRGKKPRVRGNGVTFTAPNGKIDNSYQNFSAYLYQIFNYAGTASLSKELKALSISEMQVGDLFIQGGFPGHAVLVLDMAENASGQKIYLLGQSYMPAQSFHILKNKAQPDLGPWHLLTNDEKQETAEWTFTRRDLKRF
ncbi:MAG: DUF4846 domain-containing protein [Saprospiraceae bacterium]